MKFPWTCLVMTVSLLLSVVANGEASLVEKMSNNSKSFSESQIQQRLNYMNSPVDVKANPAVMENIEAYVVSGYKGTERILGRTALYFPIFEHYLKVYRLPEALKFLPIVESRLLPEAQSSAGALGLWQFTSATARQYHLQVNETVDERRDPIKATEAAVKYLAQLYTKYKDWNLVLAAYNCGPGKLDQVIRRGGVADYWKLLSLLPEETQAYVPRFIAASYLMNYYHDHGLVPVFPSYDLQVTQTVKVFDRIGFEAIANASGVSTAVLEKLNPGFQKAYIPASTDGYYLVLPEQAMQSFQKNGKLAVKVSNTNQTQSHLVEAGETLTSIAARFKCSVKDIQYWNNMEGDQLYFRQSLIVHNTATNKERVYKS